MKLLAISGHAGSGKDAVTDMIILGDTWDNSKYFQQMFPDKVAFIERFFNNSSITVNACSDIQKVAFADKLKEALALITSTPLEFWSDSVFKDAPNTLGLTGNNGVVFTNRQLLQAFGTEVGREINPDIWIKVLFNNLHEEGSYIITDVRFKNEAKAIKEHGGKLIRVLRDLPQMQHISETELDDYPDFDIIIENNGTIRDLINKILNLKLYD